MEDQVEKHKPNKIKKGDVIVSNFGGKFRPCVIIKVGKNISSYIPMSTTEDEMFLSKCGGRFYGDSNFTMGVGFIKNEDAIKFFKGVYEHTKSLNEAIIQLRKILYRL